MELIIGLLFGVIDGNFSGGLLGALNQDKLINSIASNVGGGLDSKILAAICAFDLVGAEGEAARSDFWRNHYPSCKWRCAAYHSWRCAQHA